MIRRERTGRSRRRIAAVALAAILMDGAAQAQPSAPAASPEEVVARDMREETQRIPVTVKDMYGREEVRQIPVTVFRPRGDGPFPLVIMNHGRAVESRRAQQGRQRYEDLSRYLVGKGFVVLLPTRVGYAETYSDFDPEASGPCNARRPADGRRGVRAGDGDARVREDAALRRRVALDRRRAIGRRPDRGRDGGPCAAGLIAGINFAGGTGGDPDNRPQQPCSPQAVERLWRGLAPTARAPMLWLYWQNDQFWARDPEAVARRLAVCRRQGRVPQPRGGRQGRPCRVVDRHGSLVPIVDEFLAGLGFAKAAPVTRPPANPFAAIDQVDRVPVSTASREDAYRRFLAAPLPRAFAVGPRGAWAGAPATGRSARRSAAAGAPATRAGCMPSTTTSSGRPERGAFAELVAIAAALGWASGLRLYAVVFLTGAAGALGWVELPGGLQRPAEPRRLLGASGVLLFVEFFVDKIPGLDSVWDALHTVIRIPAGAALAAAVFGGDEAHLDHGRGAARRRPRRHQPPGQGDHARGGRRLARAVARTSRCRCSATGWCPSSSGCRGPIRCCSSSPSAWPWWRCWRRSGSWGDSCVAPPARWPCAIVGRCLPLPGTR